MAWKIQSELHGDMQSQAEMTWPSGNRLLGSNNLSVPIHHGRWKLERSRLQYERTETNGPLVYQSSCQRRC